MRKYISICFSVVILIFSSCSKNNRNVHFHGRVTYICNGSPVTNTEVLISIDDGKPNTGPIAVTTTDNNGYYSVMVEVGEVSNFKQYVIDATQEFGPANGEAYNTSNGTDILTNVNCFMHVVFSFHVKNIFPVNSNDQFDTLYMQNPGYDSNWVVYIGNPLTGMFIDQIINTKTNIVGPTEKILYYTTKNGIGAWKDTTIQLPCTDTTRVNIFY